jgi:hypothetical protein
MTHTPLTLSRRHVLGTLYNRCDNSTRIVPVYLNNPNGERLGYVDESMGKYADAFTFHLSEDNCKKLASGQFLYSFDYYFSESAAKSVTASRRRVRLIAIVLTMREGREKPIPKIAGHAVAESEPTDMAS